MRYSRAICFICSRKQVTWKLPSFVTADGKRRFFLCWPCARAVRDKLNTLPLDSPPVKKELLARGTIVKRKPAPPRDNFGS